jgi:hypothetical protein
MPEEHARLSASGSKRWLMCPPSARLAEKFPETTSEAAEEGTLAHALGELMIRTKVGRVSQSAFEDCMVNIRKQKHYCEDMRDYCEEYSDHIVSKFTKAKQRTPDAILEVEQRLDFSEWVKEGFGTGDSIIIADNYLDLDDLKYGKGVKVEAENNTQGMLYALGAWKKYHFLYDSDTIRFTIYQPRMQNISTWEIPVENLLLWAKEFAAPRAELAWEGKGEFGCGDWCRFCPAKNECKALATEQLKVFDQYEEKDAALLTDAEISDILDKAETFTNWINGITAYAADQAINNGRVWPNYKLVEGRSVRAFTDYSLVVAKLVSSGFQEDELYEKKPLGITAAEKLVGKKNFDPLLSEYIVKPSGKPTLAHVSDKRPALDLAKTAAETFKDVEL